MILERRPGLFGELIVNDLHGLRRMWIGDQLQGGAWLEPAASIPGLTGLRPGPVPACAYSCGWLVAGLHAPEGHALVVGLGAGEGVVGLLSSFPKLSVTAVEIDGTAIDMAMRYFPLLAHYRSSGRLQILNVDARGNSPWRGTPFGFAIVDANTGRNEPPEQPDFGELLAFAAPHARAVWINLIARIEQPVVRQTIAFLDSRGVRIRSIYSAQPDEMNLILGTPEHDAEQVARFEPFADLRGQGVDVTRRRFRRLAGSPLTPPR